MILLERDLNGGTQTLHKFPNGYGASVIDGGTYCYGADQGLKELAVIKFYEGDEWHCVMKQKLQTMFLVI